MNAHKHGARSAEQTAATREINALLRAVRAEDHATPDASPLQSSVSTENLTGDWVDRLNAELLALVAR